MLFAKEGQKPGLKMISEEDHGPGNKNFAVKMEQGNKVGHINKSEKMIIFKTLAVKIHHACSFDENE